MKKFWIWFEIIIFFYCFKEGIKWFHNKFGLIGDIILIGFMFWLIYVTYFTPLPTFQDSGKKPMWETNK